MFARDGEMPQAESKTYTAQASWRDLAAAAFRAFVTDDQAAKMAGEFHVGLMNHGSDHVGVDMAVWEAHEALVAMALYEAHAQCHLDVVGGEWKRLAPAPNLVLCRGPNLLKSPNTCRLIKCMRKLRPWKLVSAVWAFPSGQGDGLPCFGVAPRVGVMDSHACGYASLHLCDEVASHQGSLEDVDVFLIPLAKGFIKEVLCIINVDRSVQVPSTIPENGWEGK